MNTLKTIMTYSLITTKWVFLSTIGIFVLDMFTKGHAFGFLLYISLLVLSIAITFAIPVSIAFLVAYLYEKVDPDPERKFIIGSVIRGLGLYEGCRSVHRGLYSHEDAHKGRRYTKF